MFRRATIGAAVLLAFATHVSAQETGGSTGGFGSGAGEAGGTVRALTRFEQFAGKLKTDKTQTPLMTPILQSAYSEAAPIGQQMVQLQNQLLNAMMANKSDADQKPILDAYSGAAAQMTAVEARAFGKIYALLKPSQQGGASPAFDLMAGWFQPPAPAAGRGGRGRATEQGGGGGLGAGGGGGGRGGAPQLSRLEIMTDTLMLMKDQRKAVKTLMDDAAKSAQAVRDALAKTRPAIVGAIQANKGESDLDAAVNAYAAQATSMATIEMKALAGVMQGLTPEQRANQAAIRSTFFLMRGAFIGKNWDEAPNPDKGY